MLLLYVPVLASIFEITALPWNNLLIATILGIVPLIFGELTKIVIKKR